MESLGALHLFYDGPAPGAERAIGRLGSATRLRALMGEAEERFLESIVRRIARSLANDRRGSATASGQVELKRLRQMALICRDRRSVSQR